MLQVSGVAPDGHPTRFVRAELDRRGVVPAAGLPDVPAEERVLVAGVVTHRQRPATAQGTTAPIPHSAFRDSESLRRFGEAFFQLRAADDARRLEPRRDPSGPGDSPDGGEAS